MKYLGKVIFFILALLTFALILFPLDDLGDLVTSQVAKLTNNSIYVRFDRMGLSLVPQPGLQLNDVYVETASVPSVSVQEMTLTPSLSALLHQQPFGHFSARGFMKGNVDIEIGSSKRTEDGRVRYQIDIEAEKLSLNDIRDVAGLPMVMRGQVDLTLNDLIVDPMFSAQPEGEVSVKIQRFEMPASLLPVMGGLSLPELQLGQIVLSGRLASGRLTIASGQIGSVGDSIYGTVKGQLGLTFQNLGGVISPFLGSYNLEVDLNVQSAVGQKVPLLDMALQAYKAPSPAGTARYRLRLSAANTMMPPTMEAMR